MKLPKGQLIGKWLAPAFANGVLFLATAALAIRLAYPLTNSPAFLLLMLSLAFGAAGGLTRVWSRPWTAVAFPAGLVSILIVTVLGMEMYLGDGGDQSIMWRYVPGVEGSLAAVATTGCALAGWMLLGKLMSATSQRASRAAEQ